MIMDNRLALGLDIGTTSIAVIAVDSVTGEAVDSASFKNVFTLEGRPFERLQDAVKITEKCFEVIDSFIDKHPGILCIGITGQMHGILYTDGEGKAVSPLYTWQDMSGEAPYESGESYSKKLSRITGYPVASGYGSATYFYHKENNLVPPSAVKICTVHDFAAMALTGRKTPVTHISDAASFGLFDIKTREFDKAAIEKAGLDYGFYPDVVSGARIIGEYKNIPVCCAVGDNQASFIGSVADCESSVLVNIGTGSQISFASESQAKTENAETRPLHESKNIIAGFALCGGRAFAALEKFIRETINLSDSKTDSAYPFIDRFLAVSEEPRDPLTVRTTFGGTRADPGMRGEISGIGLDNFTPAHLIYGVMNGIADELVSIYNSCEKPTHSRVIGSGNGLRKNRALQKIIEKRLGMKLFIPVNDEEAAYGAVLYALTAFGRYKTLEDAQKLIKYKEAGDTQ